MPTDGPTTTHDWSVGADVSHLDDVRAALASFAPDAEHLVLEVVAYPLDEAREGSTTRVDVVLTPRGVIVSDDGRGTDTRQGEVGAVVKPVMSTRDLRFFDHPEAETLADGLPRRGISVVAALSPWLVHVNRRSQGSWTRTYAHGVPTGPPEPTDDDGSTGTSVSAELPDRLAAIDVDRLRALLASVDPSIVRLRA